jgi:hypothetical protein
MKEKDRKRAIKLEAELKEIYGNNKHIYVHETHTIWEDYGELHLECEQGTIVWNLESLYRDIPIMLEYCIKEHHKKEEFLKDRVSAVLNPSKK